MFVLFLYHVCRIDAYLGMSNALFARLAAVGTWSGDFITAWIVSACTL